MSLDQNLFTLTFAPHADDPAVVDLVDAAGTVHYCKRRVPQPAGAYRIDVYDPLSTSLLASAHAASAAAKQKTLELCNPAATVALAYTGTLTFRWGFRWETHDFEWRREACFILRAPDPPVVVAVTKEPPGRLRTATVQLLDYNLNRFDIDDRKGLEIVILTALLTFQDANEAQHAPRADGATGVLPMLGIGRKSSGSGPAAASTSAAVADSPPPPPPPPKPVPKTGVARIAELQAARGEYNEVTVEEEGDYRDYASYCATLLQDDALLFVTLRAAGAADVPKVLRVVEQTKRIRHKAGLSRDAELHQYVLYDAAPAPPTGRIRLDDAAGEQYAPPRSLTVYLSKIAMPELHPQPARDKRRDKDKARARDKHAKPDRDRDRTASHDRHATAGSAPPPEPRRPTRPPAAASLHAPTPPASPPRVLRDPSWLAAYPAPRPHSYHSSTPAPPPPPPPAPQPSLRLQIPGAPAQPAPQKAPAGAVASFFDKLRR